MPLQVGERVGDYQVIEILGAGGMGQVYKVRNEISKRIEAMKVLLPTLEGNAQLADRFTQEIEVQASLHHPNIAALHTAQRVGNQLVMIMEFVEGSTIESLIKKGPLPPEQAAEYCSQVLEALSYAHARGIIHRDIKPANMMLTPPGAVKLMDFGVAKIVNRDLTQTGHTVGSLYYMSPEQINSPAALDARSDLYSLGISLYEMVTGRRPFQGDSDYSVMLGHLARPPEPPIAVDASIPQALNDMILMAIQKDPAQRFQTADAFRNALATLVPAKAAAPTVAMPPPALPAAAIPEARMRSSKRSFYVAAGSLATVVVLALAAWQLPRFWSVGAERTAETEDPQVVAAPAAVPVAPVPEAPQATPPVEPSVTGTGSYAPAPPGKPKLVPGQLDPQEPSGAGVAPVSAEPRTGAETAAAAAVPPAAPAADELRDRLMTLATRARAAAESLDQIKAQQASSGLGMRGDVVSARQRMEYQFDEAEAAIKAGNAGRAKGALDRGERELERLEAFLGR